MSVNLKQSQLSGK